MSFILGGGIARISPHFVLFVYCYIWYICFQAPITHPRFTKLGPCTVLSCLKIFTSEHSLTLLSILYHVLSSKLLYEKTMIYFNDSLSVDI